jgi:hypothetical protein
MGYLNNRWIILLGFLILSGCKSDKQVLWELSHQFTVLTHQASDEKFGLRISKDGQSLFKNDTPIQIEISRNGGKINRLETGYDKYTFKKSVFEATGRITIDDSVVFIITDTWKVTEGTLSFLRNLKVSGNLDAGFMSSTGFLISNNGNRDSVKIFAPGMIYGSTDYLSEEAIGGKECTDYVRIREDRLPAPVFGAYFNDGFSFTVLNSNPDGSTTKKESHDLEANTMIDECFKFGAIGADFINNEVQIGYWFPGSEGGVTYKGKTYPYGQMRTWSRRYHPVTDGYEQNYQLLFRVEKDVRFSDYYSNAWRWSWSVLKPEINFHNIELVKRSVLDMLRENVETHHGITGIRNYIPSPEGIELPVSENTIMGFTGKTLEVANYLLSDALDDTHQHSAKSRELGEAIIQTFTSLQMDPPEGEGFSFDGTPQVAIPLDKLPEPIMYLRSFADGLKALLKAVKREKQAGIAHEAWIQWAKSFADWILPQQTTDGGFPRTWRQGTGEVYDASPESSYVLIPFLVLLSDLTGNKAYLEAAKKTGDFCWDLSQSEGIFIGGTIDNPNVIDKEAGTISLEAYLMLYQYTEDKKWLDRAVMAGNFAETWMYTWNVPMPEDENNEDLPWKTGCTTVGLQLISTGHSLTDQYMAFDVDEFAELYLHTKDPHYYDVAMILLHNTKTMLALPGREFDLKGPGWMQEHWSIAPVRGYGIHRGWLPWVSTSLLNGIIELEVLDQDLYQEMIHP